MQLQSSDLSGPSREVAHLATPANAKYASAHLGITIRMLVLLFWARCTIWPSACGRLCLGSSVTDG